MKGGTRIADQIEFVQRAAWIFTLLVPKGYGTGLQFINDRREIDLKLNVEQVEEIIKATKVGSKTRISTQLKQKILKPLVYNVINEGAKLERPFFIFCITDSCTSSKTRTEFRDIIFNCIKFFMHYNYPIYYKPLF